VDAVQLELLAEMEHGRFTAERLAGLPQMMGTRSWGIGC
jgi:hypothetical protein